MKKLQAYLKGAVTSFTAWVNYVFLAMLPVFELMKDQLPVIQQYVPEGIYRYVGLSVVIINILLAAHRKAKANGQSAA